MWFHLNGQLFWASAVCYLSLGAVAFALRRRRGIGVFLLVAAALLFLLSDSVHWIIYQQTKIPLSPTWQAGGVYFYGLAMSLYQAFPLGLLYLFSRCSDIAVKKHGHLARGRRNPHELPEHHGKRWIGLAALSFVLPLGLVTGPLGVTHTWWRLHQMDMGKINPRGRGMLVLAQAVFAMSWLSGYFLLAVSLCGFHFYSNEILGFLGFAPVLPPFWDACVYYFPTALMSLSFWQAIAAVAIYRRGYSVSQTIGQLSGVGLIVGGVVWQIVSSITALGHIAPAVKLPAAGLVITLAGCIVWLASLCGAHQIPKLAETD